MNRAGMHSADEVLQEWFSDPARWWESNPAFDQYLRDNYHAEVEAALRGDLDEWAATPRGALALVLLLDQFTRNIFRGTARMYAGDTKALATSLAIMDKGEDESLAQAERQFLYMPLMHSEDRGIQERSLRTFAEFESQRQYARQHADIVFRFGRFPHRNVILGRRSTAEEIEFLQQPGSSF